LPLVDVITAPPTYAMWLLHFQIAAVLIPDQPAACNTQIEEKMANKQVSKIAKYKHLIFSNL